MAYESQKRAGAKTGDVNGETMSSSCDLFEIGYFVQLLAITVVAVLMEKILLAVCALWRARTVPTDRQDYLFMIHVNSEMPDADDS